MIARKRWPALKKEETRKLWRVWKRSRWEFRIVISSSFIASSVLQTVCLCLLLFYFFFLRDYFGFYHSVEMQCNRGEYAAFPMTSPKDQMSKSYRLRTTTTIIGLGVVRKILATFIPHILNHLHPTSSPPPPDLSESWLTSTFSHRSLCWTNSLRWFVAIWQRSSGRRLLLSSQLRFMPGMWLRRWSNQDVVTWRPLSGSVSWGCIGTRFVRNYMTPTVSFLTGFPCGLCNFDTVRSSLYNTSFCPSLKNNHFSCSLSSFN